MTVPSHNQDTVLLSVRETRLIVERILLLTDLPKGSVVATRELILAGQGVGKPALSHLLSHFEPLRSMDPARLNLKSEGAARSSFDADGQHAWAVGPTLLDLAIDLARSRGEGEVVATNVREPVFLDALRPLGSRYHAEITVTGDGRGTVSIRATDRRAPQHDPNDIDPYLAGMLRHGFSVPRSLWLELYHLSNQSLTPDSVVSRRHAGPIIVDDNGRIIGRTDDDETDFSLLSKPVDPSTEAA